MVRVLSRRGTNTSSIFGRSASHGIGSSADDGIGLCRCQRGDLHRRETSAIQPRPAPVVECRGCWPGSCSRQRVDSVGNTGGTVSRQRSQLADDYETFLRLPGLELVAVSRAILREAARLRSQWPRLRSPDAIHAATALSRGATSLVTNDFGFRNIPGLNVILLDDLLAASAAP